jgi:hypothetical protein
VAVERRVLAELNQRQRWRGNESAIVPRQELMRFGGEGTLTGSLRGASTIVDKGLVIGADACVFVNGEPKPGWPLDAFDITEIEAIEVYAGKSEMSNTLRARWPRGALCGSPSTATPGQSALPRRPGAVSMVVIWLRPRTPR